MFFCGKKICYLSVYKHGEKEGTAGFVRVMGERDRVHLSVQIKLKEDITGKYPLLARTKEESIFLSEITLENGKGTLEKSFELEECVAFTIPISDALKVEAEWVPGEKQQIEGKQEDATEDNIEEKTKDSEDKARDNTEEVPKELQIAQEKEQEHISMTAESHIPVADDFSADKWEQLQRQFRQIHPFGDERVYIAIELKDFIILREDYQKLVHNSFLLHGFYNYQHLIIGKDCKLGNPYETCFYLGVPGVFYEKEKMVAVMFGFEGFECEGAVSVGKYGYYLRQIQI